MRYPIAPRTPITRKEYPNVDKKQAPRIRNAVASRLRRTDPTPKLRGVPLHLGLFSAENRSFLAVYSCTAQVHDFVCERDLQFAARLETGDRRERLESGNSSLRPTVSSLVQCSMFRNLRSTNSITLISPSLTRRAPFCRAPFSFFVKLHASIVCDRRIPLSASSAEH